MNIPQRHIDDKIAKHFKKYSQVMMLLGPRQAGKTTLVTRMFPRAQYFLVDNEQTLNNLQTYDINAYKQMIQPDTELVIIDEIHLLSNPGRCAKIIHDQMPHIKLVITGSSSLHIKNKTAESLAGRKIEYHLYPLTFSEYLFQTGSESNLDFRIFDAISQKRFTQRVHSFDIQAALKKFLIYGGYPFLIQSPLDPVYLNNLADSVIFKDILELGLIENRRDALNLLKLLAYQIGNLVNYSEISNRLQIDVRTVKKYIEIFEQSFLIFRIFPFSQNKRDEIVKSPKVYFFDMGLRNALIGDYSDVSIRTDRGALFENFIIAELYKSNDYLDFPYTLNYWRKKQGAEVDVVISDKNNLIGIEVKFNEGAITKSFGTRYEQAETLAVNTKNFY